MTSKKKRILIVDDEKDICEILSYNLAKEGYNCAVAHSGEEVLSMDVEGFDLLLLDVMMKSISGFELAKQLKLKNRLKIPIIFITAKNTEMDLIKGFESGGDDYIRKPFSIREVILRVKAVLNRYDKEDYKNEKQKIIEGFVLDHLKKRVHIKDEKVNLTPKEFDVLNLLVNNPGSVFSRMDILKRVWETEFVVDRTVDVTITRLRKKIGPFRKMIISRSGFGYSFESND